MLVPFICPGYIWLVTHPSTLLYSISILPFPLPSPLSLPYFDTFSVNLNNLRPSLEWSFLCGHSNLPVISPKNIPTKELSTMTPSLPSTAAHSGWTLNNQSNFKLEIFSSSLFLFLSFFTYLFPRIKYVTYPGQS